MRWPWQREKREAGGDFSDAVIRLIEAQAAGQAADTGSTAAVEAASGLLSRAFMNARVSGPSWAQDAVSPDFLAQVGRDLIRLGHSLHVLRSSSGRVRLIPCSSCIGRAATTRRCGGFVRRPTGRLRPRPGTCLPAALCSPGGVRRLVNPISVPLLSVGLTRPPGCNPKPSAALPTRRAVRSPT